MSVCIWKSFQVPNGRCDAWKLGQSEADASWCNESSEEHYMDQPSMQTKHGTYFDRIFEMERDQIDINYQYDIVEE